MLLLSAHCLCRWPHFILRQWKSGKKWNGLIASGMVHLHHAVSHIKQFGFFPCAGLLTLPSLEFWPQMQRVWFPELLDTSNFFVVRPTSNIKHIEQKNTASRSRRKASYCNTILSHVNVFQMLWKLYEKNTLRLAYGPCSR